MSHTVKINVSMIASIIAVAVSVGGVLFGAGQLHAKSSRNERDIQQLRDEVGNKLDSISARVDRILERQQ